MKKVKKDKKIRKPKAEKVSKVLKKKTCKSKSKVQRVSTGISNLDKISEGGFEKNSTNLLIGEIGSGKSIMGIQFLIEGIKKGESVLYITFEENKECFYSNMKDFGWDLESLEKKGKFFFLGYTPKKIKSMLEEGGGLVENIVIGKGIKRIVLDSITSFLLLFKDEIRKRESTMLLFELLRKWDCTTIITYEGDPLREKLDLKTLEYATDSIVLLYFIREEGDRNRYLEILKMKGTNHSRRIYPVVINSKGVSLLNKPYKGNLKKNN